MPRKVMAQSHALHSRFGFDGFHLGQHELLTSPPRFDNSQAPGFSKQLDTYSHNSIMTQAMLLKQQQFKHGSHMQEQNWSFQQQQMREYKTPVAQMATPPNSSSMSTAWVSTAFDNSIPWNMMSTNPLMLSTDNGQYSQNADLVYSPLAAHNMVGTEGCGYSEASYLTPRIGGALQGLYGSGSEPDMSVSCSPGSYFSEPREPEPLSPRSVPEQTDQSLDWSIYSTPCPSVQRSSPQSGALAYSITSAPTSTGVFPGEHRFEAQAHKVSNGLTTPSTSPVQVKGEVYGVPSLDDRYDGSGYLYSQNVAGGVSSQYLPDYSAQQPDLSRNMELVQYPSTYHNDSLGVSNANQDRLIAFRANPQTETRVVVATQGNNQAMKQSSCVTDAEAQKKLNDRILIQGKHDGLTYKEIRKKLVGEKPAESTLRGRYRSLTKARKDRVRKPVWSAIDIGLLNESVRQEFDRIARLYADPKALTRDQKLAKVQWKKVADYIDEEGGSYHFGNSTCKRKWLELNVRS